MKLNELKPNAGAKRKKLVVGRGIGSGKGKTCGVGQKGQKSRSGVAINGFEGGQMPLYKRMPKFGFSNVKFADKIVSVKLAKIVEFVAAKKLDAKKEINEDTLVEAGLLKRKSDGVKIIGDTEIKDKLNLKVSKISKGAQALVEKAGGKVELIVKEIAPVKNGKAKGSKKG